jgi:hypothetical protein
VLLYREPYYGQPPHEADSDTSEQAAQDIRPHAGRLRSLVLSAIRDAGRRGCTDEELEDRLRLPHQTVSARRRELVLRGWVRDSGARRRNPRSGRSAAVWVAGLASAVEMAPRPAIKKPSSREIEDALAEIRLLLRAQRRPPSPALVAVGQWLRARALIDR